MKRGYQTFSIKLNLVYNSASTVKQIGIYSLPAICFLLLNLLCPVGIVSVCISFSRINMRVYRVVLHIGRLPMFRFFFLKMVEPWRLYFTISLAKLFNMIIVLLNQLIVDSIVKTEIFKIGLIRDFDGKLQVSTTMYGRYVCWRYQSMIGIV